MIYEEGTWNEEIMIIISSDKNWFSFTSCAGTAATGWAGIVKRLWVEAMGTPPGT